MTGSTDTARAAALAGCPGPQPGQGSTGATT